MAFTEDTCFKRKRLQTKVTPRKVEVGLKRRRELNTRRWNWRLAWWGSTEKEVLHLLKLRGKQRYSDQSSSRMIAPCVASTAAGTEREEDQIARSSATEEGS